MVQCLHDHFLWLLYPSGKNDVLHHENNSIDTGQVEVGRRVGQSLPPGVFWRSRLTMEQPHFLKFNISVQKNALIGVYGRKGLAPTHTQVKSESLSLLDSDLGKLKFIVETLIHITSGVAIRWCLIQLLNLHGWASECLLANTGDGRTLTMVILHLTSVQKLLASPTGLTVQYEWQKESRIVRKEGRNPTKSKH